MTDIDSGICYDESEVFDIKARDYKNRIDEIITLLSAGVNDTRKGINMLKELVLETQVLLD